MRALGNEKSTDGNNRAHLVTTLVEDSIGIYKQWGAVYLNRLVVGDNVNVTIDRGGCSGGTGTVKLSNVCSIVLCMCLIFQSCAFSMIN